MTYSVEETLRIQTVKLNQQLNKLLEQNTKILELEAERDTLRQKNAELAAQVEVFSNHLAEFQKASTLDDAVAWESKSNSLLDSTPAQCLLEVKAEAGRAGFIAGYMAIGHFHCLK